MDKIKNYTSTVPMTTTLARIETILVEHGATHINKEYIEKVPAVIYFKIDIGGKIINIRLDAKIDAVYAILEKSVKRPQTGTRERLIDQAAKTAWKIIQDWVEIQMAMVALGQAELPQVFLGYIYDGISTYYDHLKSGGFLLEYKGETQ